MTVMIFVEVLSTDIMLSLLYTCMSGACDHTSAVAFGLSKVTLPRKPSPRSEFNYKDVFLHNTDLKKTTFLLTLVCLC